MTSLRGDKAFGSWARFFAVSLGLSAAFVAGVAYGDDSKLDQALSALTSAVSLVKDAPTQGSDFEEHRKKAVDLLTRAQGEIVKAKSQ